MAKFIDRISDYIANYVVEQLCYEENEKLASPIELISLKYRKDPDKILEKFYVEPPKDKKLAIESLQPIFTQMTAYKTPAYSYNAEKNEITLTKKPPTYW
jgi:hypothetical protein